MLALKDKRYYFGSMKRHTNDAVSPALARAEKLLSTRTPKDKTSISISKSLLEAADIITGKAPRSAVFERALRRYLKSEVRVRRNERDLKLINANARRQNKESDDLLELQSWPE
jgi:hypothetical protein